MFYPLIHQCGIHLFAPLLLPTVSSYQFLSLQTNAHDKIASSNAIGVDLMINWDSNGKDQFGCRRTRVYNQAPQDCRTISYFNAAWASVSDQQFFSKSWPSTSVAIYDVGVSSACLQSMIDSTTMRRYACGMTFMPLANALTNSTWQRRIQVQSLFEVSIYSD